MSVAVGKRGGEGSRHSPPARGEVYWHGSGRRPAPAVPVHGHRGTGGAAVHHGAGLRPAPAVTVQASGLLLHAGARCAPAPCVLWLISLISRSGAPLHQTTTDAALDQASALSTSACAPTAALTRSSASTPLPRPRRLLHHLLHPSPRLGIPPARPPAPTSPLLPPFMPATPQPKTVVLLLPYPPPPHQTLPASTHPFA